MNYNTLLALLAKLNLVEKEKAEALAKALNNGIAPARYADAEKFIKDVFEKLD